MFYKEIATGRIIIVDPEKLGDFFPFCRLPDGTIVNKMYLTAYCTPVIIETKDDLLKILPWKNKNKSEVKQMYTANYYNANGATTSLKMSAKTLLGAKRESYDRADGTTTKIILTDDSGIVATRSAKDSFSGFCRGAKKWENK